jgi:tRNA threonylcarbamoyl adenosine modification protein YeaZ
MKVLALETGGAHWGVACALCDAKHGEADLLAARTSDRPRELSTQLFAHIQSTLDAAGWSLEDVETLSVGLGPGSWTGLRIGLSAAKTLAQTRGWCLAGVPSFDATAQAVWRFERMKDEGGRMNNSDSNFIPHPSSLILVAAPCRPGEIYAKIYEAGEDYLAVLQSEWIGAHQLVADTLSTEALSRGLEAAHLLCGGAAHDIADLLDARSEKYSLATPGFEHVLLELAIAGALQVAETQTGADEANSRTLALQPLYLAPSNAERNLLAR